MTTQNAPRTATGAAAAVVVAIEGAFLGLAAILYVALGVSEGGSAEQLSLALAAVSALASAALLLLARGLWGARRWAVSPAITWQVLQGFVGAYLVSEHRLVFGLVLLAIAIAGLVPLASLARSLASAGQDLDGAREAVDDDDAAKGARGGVQ